MINEKLYEVIGEISDKHIKEAKKTYSYDLQQQEKQTFHRFSLRAAMAFVCMLVMIPITVYAVESIFGISLVKIRIGNTSNGNYGIGYEIDYPEITSRPLSDFSEEIQNIDGHETEIYDSWKDAEAKLGITLVNNTLLSGKDVTKEYVYDLKEQGIPARVHCYANYQGKENRFYGAAITAGYRYDGMSVTLRSTVTCEHPSISKEEEQSFHWIGVGYEKNDVAEILQEQYVTENGITATIVSVIQKKNRGTNYEASFSANGASYRIAIYSNVYDCSYDDEAKANLIKILEGFIF